MIKILFTLILLLHTPLVADTLIIDSDLRSQSVLKGSALFIDADGNRSAEEVLDDPSLFSTFKSKKIELGFTTKQVWIRFSIKNSSEQLLHPLLELDNPMLDYIHLYRVEESKVISKVSQGLLLPYDFQGPLNFNFELSIEPERTQEYLLQVHTTGCALYFQAAVITKQELFHKELHRQMMITLFIGLILGLIVYNFFIYFFTRDSAYLYYVGYQSFIVLNYFTTTTITKHIFEPSLMAVDAFLGIYYLMGLVIFMLLFTRSFLRLHQFRWIDTGIKILLTMAITLIVITFSCCYLIDVSVYIALLSSLYLIGISLYLMLNKYPHATYFVIGWGVSLASMVTVLLYQIGLASYMEESPYLFEVGISFEAILFSVVLAQRINHTKALSKALDIHKVLVRELHHRVKNNMQLIISLYRLKFSFVKDNAISTRLLENENNIIAMSAIHEVLYSQENLEELDTQIYFQQLTDLLYDTLSQKNISIIFDSHVSLPPQQAIYCGIILNELVTNAIKYAFDEGEKGKITISLYEKKNKVTFCIKDDGKGYDESIPTESFGLVLVKALAEGELHATMVVNNKNGSSHCFIWDK